MDRTIRISAAAKINLTLDITGKRSDGYHDLRSIMQSVSIFDCVTLEENASGKLTLECNVQGVPCDERNIAAKCARAFYGETDIVFEGLHITIEKNIPMQAGLAGGSADGAAVLWGLNELYGSPLPKDRLTAAGAKVGADIPFCLTGGTVLCEGIGEILTKLPDITPCFFVIVKPDIGISTAEAYGAVDKAGMSFAPSTDKALEAIGDLDSLCKCLHNDFEQALAIPELNILTARLKGFEGCLGACMSGSGSAVFAVFSDSSSAEKCAAAMSEEYAFAQVAQPAAGCRRF